MGFFMYWFNLALSMVVESVAEPVRQLGSIAGHKGGDDGQHR